MLNRYRLRVMIQLLFLIVSLLIVYLTANFIAHAYCPYAVICFGLRGINPGSHYLFVAAIIGGIIILLSTLFIGRRFCGYVCPLGTVVEYLNYLNPFRKKQARKMIPPNIEKTLRVGKYIILILTAILALFLYSFYYFQLCPVMLATLSTEFTLSGIAVLLIIVSGSIMIRRFWCRYLCPYAAFMNCFQFIGKLLRIKPSRIYRNLEVCTDCHCCEYNCQMNIIITDQEYIDDYNCIYCLNCIKACPKDQCLKL